MVFGGSTAGRRGEGLLLGGVGKGAGGVLVVGGWRAGRAARAFWWIRAGDGLDMEGGGTVQLFFGLVIHVRHST